jgi:hypothetical protein
VMADAKAPLVRVAGGMARIEAEGQAHVDYAWNGCDKKGRAVAPGHYEYTGAPARPPVGRPRRSPAPSPAPLPGAARAPAAARAR